MGSSISGRSPLMSEGKRKFKCGFHETCVLDCFRMDSETARQRMGFSRCVTQAKEGTGCRFCAHDCFRKNRRPGSCLICDVYIWVENCNGVHAGSM